jgi:hypothetical protein
MINLKKIASQLLIFTLIISSLQGCEKSEQDKHNEAEAAEAKAVNLANDAAILFILINTLTIKDSILYSTSSDYYNCGTTDDEDCLKNKNNHSLYRDYYDGYYDFSKKNNDNYPPLPFASSPNSPGNLFGLGNIASAINNKEYYSIPLWVYDLGKDKTFGGTSQMILTKFQDIAYRLHTAYNSQSELIGKYGADFPIKNIDDDIRHLSSLGWQLVEPTKRFFALAKEHMMKVDEANARAEAMHGLKTFTQEIEAAGNQPSEALEQSVADITAAINNLEKALNE